MTGSDSPDIFAQDRINIKKDFVGKKREKPIDAIEEDIKEMNKLNKSVRKGEVPLYQFYLNMSEEERLLYMVKTSNKETKIL